MPEKGSGGRDAAVGLLLSVAAVTLILVLGEGLVRLLELRPERQGIPRYLGWDGRNWIEAGTWGGGTIKRSSPFPEVKMGEYAPGAQFRILYSSNPRGYFDDDGGVPARINRLGLRGPEVPFRKREGTFRILGLGDSFTFGVGVRDEDTWLRRLEGRLDGAGKGDFEVLNAGVGGYNTRDELIYLEHRWSALEPDLVLIGFYLNDAYQEEAFFNIGEGGLMLLLREPEGLAKSSHLWDFLQFRYLSRRLRGKVANFYKESYFTGRMAEARGDVYDWPAAKGYLERAIRLGRERGFKVALILLPHFYGFDSDYPFEDIHRLVMEECRRIGMPALDILDTFRGRRAEELWVHVTDHHPNEEAHDLIASTVAEFLSRPALGILDRGEAQR